MDDKWKTVAASTLLGCAAYGSSRHFFRLKRAFWFTVSNVALCTAFGNAIMVAIQPTPEQVEKMQAELLAKGVVTPEELERRRKVSNDLMEVLKEQYDKKY